MRVIKRYSNRKLYDTKESRYVTLAHLLMLVRGGQSVQVVTHVPGPATGDMDITVPTLLQALAAEGGGEVSAEGVHKAVREGLRA